MRHVRDVRELNPFRPIREADYLGLAIETVSRVLSTLHKEGVISVLGSDHRRIVIRDKGRLSELSAD
jgi:hypothetical protein